MLILSVFIIIIIIISHSESVCFLKEINTFIHHICIIFIKSDSKDF